MFRSVRILSRTSSKTKTGQYVLSFVLFESGSDSNRFGRLRSASVRAKPRSTGPCAPFHSGRRRADVHRTSCALSCTYLRQSLINGCLYSFVYTMSQVDKRACTQLSIWRMYIIELLSEMVQELPDQPM